MRGRQVSRRATLNKFKVTTCLFPRPYINDQVLDIEHTGIVEKALAEFDSRKKLGGEEFSLKYRDQLLTEIEESYQHYKAHNDSKNIFKAANTPITLFVMWTVLYIFSQVRPGSLEGVTVDTIPLCRSPRC